MVPRIRSHGVRPLLSRLLKFAATSGTGLAIDLLLFFGLIEVGWSPAISNFCSASMGVLFVFFASLRGVFQHEGRYLGTLLVSYVSFQFLAVVAASAAVSLLVQLIGSPLLSKLIILPVTFGANFLFMSLIVHFANGRSGNLLRRADR